MNGFHRDVNARAPAFVRDHLVSAGLEELASIDFWDKGFIGASEGLRIQAGRRLSFRICRSKTRVGTKRRRTLTRPAVEPAV